MKHNIQTHWDDLCRQMRVERARSQMTLGTLHSFLKSRKPSDTLSSFGEPHSYRGYYDDLAFEKVDGLITAQDALEMVDACIGQVFTGYKGGEFLMDENTPIWLANYGSCGLKIMGFDDFGNLELAPDEY